jgi:hypothetical protein
MNHQPIENQTSATTWPGTKGLRCLIVEDDLVVRERVASQLASLGCETQQVGDGFGAIRLLREASEAGSPFQLLLIENLLPGVKPKIVAAMIRQDSRLAGIRLALLQRVRDSHEVCDPAGFGFSLALPEDIRTDDLEASLESLFAGPSEKSPSPPLRVLPESPQACGNQASNLLKDRGSRGRILVVDDMASNRKLMEILLKKDGWDVTGAQDGQEALDLIGSQAFDLVFMDCQMPGMDGLEATRLIRQRGDSCARGELPVIALTAANQEDDRSLCQQAGMSDFLPKPFDREQLEDVLLRWGPIQEGSSS